MTTELSMKLWKVSVQDYYGRWKFYTKIRTQTEEQVEEILAPFDVPLHQISPMKETKDD